MTCLDCGEIATHSHDSVGNPLTYCPRCTTDEELDGEERLDLRRNARLVPTMTAPKFNVAGLTSSLQTGTMPVAVRLMRISRLSRSLLSISKVPLAAVGLDGVYVTAISRDSPGGTANPLVATAKSELWVTSVTRSTKHVVPPLLETVTF